MKYELARSAGSAFRIIALGVLLLPLGKPIECSAQWQRLFLTGHSWISNIYFLDLPGPPRIGFFTEVDTLFKTTDGGRSWKAIRIPDILPLIAVFQYSDFAFKDSTTGWVTFDGGDSALSGVFKTTDQGDSWHLQHIPESFSSGIFYDSLTHGLFLEGLGLWGNTYQSWDDGNTWQVMTGGTPEEVGGFAFANLDSGIMATPGGYWQPTPWSRTFDGGHTWEQCAIDSNCYQPLAIPGTETYFAITFFGTILRTDDSWNTWQVLYQFPWPSSIQFIPIVTAPTYLPTSSCIRGTLNSLFVQTGLGIYRSTDQGVTWNYLCGPISNNVNWCRFYVKDNFIYCGSWDMTQPSWSGSLWMLDLDSLQSPKADFAPTFSNGTTLTSLSAGDTLRLVMNPLSDLFQDSAHFTISYDPDVLSWKGASLPAGWSVTSSNTTGLLDLVCINGSSQSLLNQTFSISFNTILSKLGSEVVVERAQVLSHEFSSDCLAENLPPPDTLRFSFTGCGDSALFHFMQTGKFPFTVQSIVPNPASGNLTVTLSSSATNSVQYEIFDALGHTSLEGTMNGTPSTIDLQGLASGSYFLRLSAQGQTESRRIVVER